MRRKSQPVALIPTASPGADRVRPLKTGQNPLQAKVPTFLRLRKLRNPGSVAHKQIVGIRTVRDAIVFSAEPQKARRDQMALGVWSQHTGDTHGDSQSGTALRSRLTDSQSADIHRLLSR